MVPDPYPGNSAYSLAQESEYGDIQKMILGYANGERMRGGGRYDPKEYNQLGGGNQYQGGYNRKGEYRPGDHPDSPNRLGQQGSGVPQNNPGNNKQRKEGASNVISGNQPTNAQLSLTVPGAKQVMYRHQGTGKEGRQGVKATRQGRRPCRRLPPANERPAPTHQ
jgi:hypothetical protein